LPDTIKTRLATGASSLPSFLEEKGYYEVTWADSGGVGFMLCHERTPDAVVLDLNMPGIDGLSILRQLRILHPTLPVVVFSGHSAKDVEEETLNQGATAFIQKAFSLDLLGSWTKSAFTSRKVNLSIQSAAPLGRLQLGLLQIGVL
jgi:DNA-binding response OmpR family regulator